MEEEAESRVRAGPGGRLDMNHGFVHHIRRNQKARDDYDKEVKQAKEKQRKRHTPGPSRPRKPDLQVYHPHPRGESCMWMGAPRFSGPSVYVYLSFGIICDLLYMTVLRLVGRCSEAYTSASNKTGACRSTHKSDGRTHTHPVLMQELRSAACRERPSRTTDRADDDLTDSDSSTDPENPANQLFCLEFEADGGQVTSVVVYEDDDAEQIATKISVENQLETRMKEALKRRIQEEIAKRSVHR